MKPPSHQAYTAADRVKTKSSRAFNLLLILAAGLMLMTSGQAATVTLKPDADTSLFETSPDNNMGGTDLAAGTTARGKKSRALIRFDVAGALPPNAKVSSVQLSVRVTKTPPGGVPSTFGVHRLLQDWGEGNKSSLVGDPAEAEEATWLARFFPATRWTSPGAASGSDYVAKASGTRLVAGVGSYTFNTSVDLVADVQFWKDNPDSNFGWIMISQLENALKTARRFGSLEDANQSPTLVIEYTESTPVIAPSISSHPQNQSVTAGGTASFNVAATGSAPLTFQWLLNNQAIAGATSTNLTLTNVQAAQAGAYTVKVTGPGGEITSNPASLTVVPVAEPGKKWTIMVYGHADHNLSASLIADMQEMEAAGSAQDFNIVVQADFDASSPANSQAGLPPALSQGISRFLMQKDADPNQITSQPLERLPETMNMDDPAVLTAFISWAAQKFPADRYGLVLWNHGGQWQGFGGDSQDGTLADKGILSTAQIRQAVTQAMESSKLPKWEFVAFDTCLMGGAEVLTDFVPLTDVFIACSEIDYGDGWDYGATFNFLKANPAVSALDFGKAEVKAWEQHHFQPGKDSDLELGAHGLYDLTKYSAFEQKFNSFTSLLLNAANVQSSILPRIRLETTQYSLGGVKELGKPTDYIDLGELADRLAADPSTDAALKSAARELSASIDALVAAKVRGAKKQQTHGLSVFYPPTGSKDNAGYLGLSISSKPGSAWTQLLAKVAGDKAADNVAPEIVAVEEEGGAFSTAFFSGSASLAAVVQPASVRVQVSSGADAYSLFASIVDNHFTSRTNEFVYLGEVASRVINGLGKFDIPWNGTLPVLSSPAGPARVFLGGFYEEAGSDILISFADYVPPGTTNSQLVLVLTQIKDGKGTVIGVLDGEEEDEGLAPKGIDVQAGGSLTPVYYMERREGDDPDNWVSDSVTARSSVIIPPTGLSGLGVSFGEVPDAVYSLEVQVMDVFENESEVLTYAMRVGPVADAPSLVVSAGSNGEIVVSWPASATTFVLESNSTLSTTGWSAVPSGSITTTGNNRRFSEPVTAVGTSKFYRLRRN